MDIYRLDVSREYSLSGDLTTINVMRHAEVFNPQRVLYGRLPGFELSLRGWLQAFVAAWTIRECHLTVIYCSPLLRARQTARVVALFHPDIRVEVSELLNEIRSPYQGVPLTEMEARRWDLYTGVAPPYEQQKDVLARINRFISDTRERYPGQDVLAVTHGDLIALPIHQAERRTIAPRLRLDPYPPYASCTTFYYRNRELNALPSYEMWNAAGHLVIMGPRLTRITGRNSDVRTPALVDYQGT